MRADADSTFAAVLATTCITPTASHRCVASITRIALRYPFFCPALVGPVREPEKGNRPEEGER